MINHNKPRRPPAVASSSVEYRGPRNSQGLPVERLIRIERRKARNRAITLAIFVMAIMLVTLLLIIAVMKQAKPSPRFIFIQEGELSHTVQSTGLIIRDELTFKAPTDGLIKPRMTEGSRAAKGQELALIIPADKESQLLELQKCEKDIASKQAELMNAGKGAGAQAIFDESAASLTSIVNLIRSDASKGTLSNMNAYSTSIEVILEQRTTKLAVVDFEDAVLDDLNARRASLESTLGLAAGTLICQKPGIVSFKLDGLEEVLTIDKTSSITVAEYQSYIGQKDNQIVNSGKVSKDQQVLRISSSLNQYLVFLLPNTNAALFKVDDFKDIMIPGDNLTIENCRVVRSETSGSDAFVVFKTDRQVERLSDLRTIQAELPMSATTGLMVPYSSLIDYDQSTGEASLMIVDEGVTRVCKVMVADIDDNMNEDTKYAIIKAIETEQYQPKVSTVLVVNPESIKAGELIGN